MTEDGEMLQVRIVANRPIYLDTLRGGSTIRITLAILLYFTCRLVCSQTYVDHFTDGKSQLGFTPRQPERAPAAVGLVTVDDPSWGYLDEPVRNNPSGDQSVMRVGNLEGAYYGVAEATLWNNDVGQFEELTDVRIEAWVYCLAPGPTIRARVGLYIRDTSDNFPDSLGNGEESFPPQVHYDSSIYAGPGFGTSGFITAIEDLQRNLVPPAGSEGFVLVEVSDGVETRVNDVFNRTILTENRWVKMFAHAVGHSLTVGADLDGDGRFEPGPPGDSEVAFYPDIRNYDADGNIIDPNDIGRVGCFAVVTEISGEFTGVTESPAFFDEVKISVGTAVTDWALH